MYAGDSASLEVRGNLGVAAAGASPASILTTGVALRLGADLRPMLAEIKRNLRAKRYAKAE